MRETLYSAARAKIILERVSAGAPLKDAAAAAGVSYRTLARWIKNEALLYTVVDPATGDEVEMTFLSAFTRADAEYVVNCQAIITKSIRGWDTRTETVKTETILAKKKTTYPDGTTVIEEIPVEKKTVLTTTGREFDPASARWWLERRRRAEYGNNVTINYDQAIEDAVSALLAPGGVEELAGAGEEEALGAAPAGESGTGGD
jgi:AcrR family transcriptional regulator